MFNVRLLASNLDLTLEVTELVDSYFMTSSLYNRCTTNKLKEVKLIYKLDNGCTTKQLRKEMIFNFLVNQPFFNELVIKIILQLISW